ncbi:MAG: type II toxin-antitoxin system PemK/MazF family toxin [Myxococcaceae bacterium]
METQAAKPEEAMRQYEVWWANLPRPVGRRPVMLLSRDAAYGFLNSVLAVEITTTLRGIPQELSLGAREGLPRRCVANFDSLHAVQRTALLSRIGSLGGSRVREAKRALGYALGWPELVLPE